MANESTWGDDMFSCTQSSCISFSFPDVCNTYVGVASVPIPYPNFAFSSMAVPNIYNLYTEAMPDHNLLTTTTITTGDEAGTLLGVASGMIIGQSMHMIGSFKVYKSAIPATKMLCPTMQNGISPNIIGITISPSQVKVMILS